MNFAHTAILVVALFGVSCQAGDHRSWRGNSSPYTSHSHLTHHRYSTSTPAAVSTSCEVKKVYVCSGKDGCESPVCQPVLSACGPNLKCPFDKKCINFNYTYTCVPYECKFGKKCFNGPRRLCAAVKDCSEDPTDCSLETVKMCGKVSEESNTWRSRGYGYKPSSYEDCKFKYVKKCAQKCANDWKCSKKLANVCETDDGKAYHSDCFVKGVLCGSTWCKPGEECEPCEKVCKWVSKLVCQ